MVQPSDTAGLPGPGFRQSGIQRIDLAILLSCLMMLGAVAVPRIMTTTEQSRRELAVTLSESIANASRQLHSIWLEAGQPAGLVLDGDAIEMVNGYPSPDAVSSLLEPDEQDAFSFNDGSWQHQSVSRRSLCGVSYWPPARPGDPPVIESHLGGC